MNTTIMQKLTFLYVFIVSENQNVKGIAKYTQPAGQPQHWSSYRLTFLLYESKIEAKQKKVLSSGNIC